MTYDDFIVQFPEFDEADEEFVQAHLDAAELELDEEVWGTKFDQGHGYLTAHKLTLSPYGQNQKFRIRDGNGDQAPTTTYEVHYKRLVRMVSSGFRVA